MRRRSNSKKKKTQQSSSTASQPKSNDGYNKTNDSIATTATSTSPSKPRHFLLQLAEKFPIIAITLSFLYRMDFTMPTSISSYKTQL